MTFVLSFSTRKRRRHITQRGDVISLVMVLIIVKTTQAADSTIDPRWGHAAAYIPSPPAIIFQGGKTDTSSSYTYSSAPNTDQVLLLPLDSSFSNSSPPISILNSTSAPAYAWNTLTPTARQGGAWQFLSFGGDGGSTEAVQTSTDSAWLVDVDPSTSSANFTHQLTSWGEQPMRRIYHSATSSTNGGITYISGGLKDDGSGTTFTDVYCYNPSTSTFSTLPNLPIGIYHHTSLLLPNGTLVVMGGVSISSVTGSAAVQPYSTVYTLDTTATSPSWIERTMAGTLPDGRRGASAVVNSNGSQAFLFGGANAALSTVYGDGYALNLKDCIWQQVSSDDQGKLFVVMRSDAGADQAVTGPGARFDHAAVPVGNGQIVLFGGYGDGSPASSDIHIWDSNSNSWSNSYTPSTATTSSSATATGASTATSSGESGGTSSSSAAMSNTRSGTASAYSLSPGGASSSVTSTQSISSPSDPSSTDAGAYSHPLTAGIRVGLILGVLALLAALLGVCLWQYRKRQRRRRAAIIAATKWPTSGPRGRAASDQYGHREKGSPDLPSGEATSKEIRTAPANWETGASIGLGMGAIGATLASISSKLAGNRQGKNSHDPYAELQDESTTSGDHGGPLRKSTRRVGNGIQLLGPRPQRDKSMYYAPVHLGSASVRDRRATRPTSGVRDSRIEMFEDEDRPRGGSSPIDEEDDWEIDSNPSPSKWEPAHNLLNRERSNDNNPFTDQDENEESHPVRGGPVPTPDVSRTDLGTYDEIATMSNPYSELSRNPYSDVSRNRYSTSSDRHSVDYHLPDLSPSDPLDLAGLLPPMLSRQSRQYSDRSIPHSQRSGGSNAMSDAEEGVLQEARMIRHLSPTIVSPVETSYQAIKRTESFFKRMAAGGISSLLSRSLTGSTTRQEIKIRDPAPQPTLWPVISKDEYHNLTESSPIGIGIGTGRHPPTSWNKDTLLPPRQGQGPSLSSLNSARSMRDMIIVQREHSEDAESASIAIMEDSSSPPSSSSTPQQIRHERSLAEELDQADTDFSPKAEAEQTYMDILSPLMSDVSSLSLISRSDGLPSGSGHHRYGRSTGLETPGSIVFNGAEFASPPLLPSLPPIERLQEHLEGCDPTSRAASPPTLGAAVVTRVKELSPNAKVLPSASSTATKDQNPKRITSLCPISITPERPKSPNSNSTSNSKINQSHGHTSAPPSGSPVPPPLVSHRRAVKDVVESINKRGGKTPLPPPISLFSPVSTYSPVIPSGRIVSPTAPPAIPVPILSVISKAEAEEKVDNPFVEEQNQQKQVTATTTTPATTLLSSRVTTGTRIPSLQPQTRTTMREVMKRERLRVANPDHGKGVTMKSKDEA